MLSSGIDGERKKKEQERSTMEKGVFIDYGLGIWIRPGTDRISGTSVFCYGFLSYDTVGPMPLTFLDL